MFKLAARLYRRASLQREVGRLRNQQQQNEAEIAGLREIIKKLRGRPSQADAQQRMTKLHNRRTTLRKELHRLQEELDKL